MILVGYLISIVFLFFYSFTQVDLGLTLTRHPFWLPYQRIFQSIGYFNRPLSTYLYCSVLVLLFLFYFFLLRQVQKKQIKIRQMWGIVLIASGILLFSYNAFSYDLFNYIFDAKIITHYGQNPYLHKALDYPGDPMLSFMHWTHRVYPYGSAWLLLTVPLSFIGLQFFLPTLILFKVLIVGSYIGTVYYIQKISQKLFNNNSLLITTFFALNPLVIIESLVSAHNDIVMMFFAVLAMYLLVEKKYITSVLILLVSIGIKFATALLIPIFVYILVQSIQKKDVNWEKIFMWQALLMIVAIIFSSVRTELQPWYFLWVVPFSSFLVNKKWIFISSVIFSFILLLYYIPFLYSGNWDPPIPVIKNWLIITGFVISGLVIFITKFKKNRL